MAQEESAQWALPGPVAHCSVSVRRYCVQSEIFFSWLEFNLSEHMGHVLSLFSKLGEINAELFVSLQVKLMGKSATSAYTS